MLEERDLNGDARRILRAADIVAERVSALVRIGAATTLLILLLIVVGDMTGSSDNLRERVRVAQITLALFFASGALAWGVIRLGRWSPALGYVTSTMDMLFILGNVWHHLLLDRLSADFMFLPPAVWGLPIFLAASALRLRPGLQAYASLVGIGGLAALGLAIPTGGEARHISDALSPLVAVETNAIRFAMLTIAAGTLVLATARARLLLVRAVSEAHRRRAITRFLPGEIAGLIRDGDFSSGGSRHPASVLFIDMRDSTALAERMPPERLNAFMTDFRTRIARTVRMHGGMIDKYIGDGALILFGVPQPRPDDAIRALACAEALAVDLSEWSRASEEAIGFGIGLHHGPVFFGVIGDPDRLEATVLGDSVNVAARLEKATRDFDQIVIVSGETLDVAGWSRKDRRLRPLGATRLRGRSAEVELYALVPEVPALVQPLLTTSLDAGAA